MKNEAIPNAQQNFLQAKVEELCNNRTPILHIQAMDYPRMAGTEGNKQGVTYIKDVFKEYGFEPVTEEFYLPNISKIQQLILPFILSGWGFLSYYCAIHTEGVVRNILGGVLLLLPIILVIFLLRLELLFKRMTHTAYLRIQKTAEHIERGTYRHSIQKGQNIYVEYHPKDNKVSEHLYITAHHDSTTLRFRMKILKYLILIALLTGLIYIFGYVFNYISLLLNGPNWFMIHAELFLIILGMFLGSINIILIGRIFRTNQSHGANDDLTGVSLLLELAAIVKTIQPKLNITFIAFDAEELGLYGSAYHFYTHRSDFNPQQTRVLSIDMIGEVPPLLLVSKIKPALGIPMNPQVNKELKSLAEQLEITVKIKRFPYPGSDFATWFLNGFSTNWMMSASKVIHSPADIAKTVNKELLMDCLKLGTAYLLTKSAFFDAVPQNK
ncbi:MAG: M28 family metallopeptidase [Candidatus Helarchaeota archaeon]